jgi:hypothetical protein
MWLTLCFAGCLRVGLIPEVQALLTKAHKIIISQPCISVATTNNQFPDDVFFIILYNKFFTYFHIPLLQTRPYLWITYRFRERDNAHN